MKKIEVVDLSKEACKECQAGTCRLLNHILNIGVVKFLPTGEVETSKESCN